jgi:putative acetyltransferase
MDIRVRPLEPADIPDVHAVFQCPRVLRFTTGIPSPLAETERRLSPSPGTHHQVAVVDQRVVGVVGLHGNHTPRRRHLAQLGISVHDEHQGRGIGGALLASILALADQYLGLVRVELTVDVDNPRAIALYERHGFVHEGRLRASLMRDAVYVDSLQMARVREPPRLSLEVQS